MNQKKELGKHRFNIKAHWEIVRFKEKICEKSLEMIRVQFMGQGFMWGKCFTKSMSTLLDCGRLNQLSDVSLNLRSREK